MILVDSWRTVLLVGLICTIGTSPGLVRGTSTGTPEVSNTATGGPTVSPVTGGSPVSPGPANPSEPATSGGDGGGGDSTSNSTGGGSIMTCKQSNGTETCTPAAVSCKMGKCSQDACEDANMYKQGEDNANCTEAKVCCCKTDGCDSSSTGLFGSVSFVTLAAAALYFIPFKSS